MPHEPSPSHPIKSVEVALGCLRSLGYSSKDCLAQTGISEASVADPASDVSLTQELALYRNVARMAAGAPVGLQIGEAYRVENYGIWGLALMSAATVRESIQIAIQFQALTYSFFHYSFDETDGAGVITLTPFADYGNSRELLADRDMAATALILNQVSGRVLTPKRILVRHQKPDHAADYETYYGCAVEWNENAYSIHIACEDLDAQPPQYNPETAAFCAAQCTRLVADSAASSTLTSRVRHRLSLHHGNFPDVENLSAELGLSYRSLRRRLREEGTSYQALLDEARFNLAKNWLTHTDMRLIEITASLNFSEPGNFTHAFKRWSGITPSSYRRQLTGNE